MTATERHPPRRTTPPARAGSPRRSRSARGEGRAALIPYVVAGYPDADGRSRRRAPRSTPVPTCSRSGCRTRTRSPTARRSSGRPRVALATGATFERSLALVARIARRATRRAARPDGLREPAHRRRRRARSGAGARGRGRRRASSSRTSRPTRAAPFEAVAAEAGIAVVYLVAPTTATDRRAAVAARSGGFLYCVSLVGVTGARTVAAADGREARPRGEGRLAGPGRGRVRGLEAGARAGDRPRRRGRRDRRVRARRRARRRRHGRRGAGGARRPAARCHGPLIPRGLRTSLTGIPATCP